MFLSEFEEPPGDRVLVCGDFNDAPAPYGVRYGHFKEADVKVVKQITEDVNQSLKTSVTPEEW